jgi:hypothetical protein
MHSFMINVIVRIVRLKRTISLAKMGCLTIPGQDSMSHQLPAPRIWGNRTPHKLNHTLDNTSHTLDSISRELSP